MRLSNSLAIAAVTATLRDLLSQGISADLPSTEVTTRPLDRAREGRAGNQVNLFLYTASVDGGPRPHEPIRAGDPVVAPLPLSLHYLVTAFGENDDDALGQRLLGRAMGILHDRPVLDAEAIRGALPRSDLHERVEHVRITPAPMTVDEMSNLWAAAQTPYRVSTAYRASIVFAGTGRGLQSLARRIEPRATWEDIVLADEELGLLRQIVDQVRGRACVGISALFVGPSGTGKTMAAEVIAGELGLDLYRIDLSAVVSKYIGETEKSLRRLFDAAEAGGALLLFDEADALFGRRSEVEDGHDRYANDEIGYLLERMECYRGVAILAANRKSSIDPAFIRRLRFVVTFPEPGG